MARGEGSITKVTYKGAEGTTYVVIVDSMEDYENWKKDASIPLAQVVAGFKVFTTHKYVSSVSPVVQSGC